MVNETVSHYRLLNKLGAGGMGEVYLAKDLDLDRDVAIKFPSSSNLDEKDRARFLREARLASALHHPNIAKLALAESMMALTEKDAAAGYGLARNHAMDAHRQFLRGGQRGSQVCALLVAAGLSANLGDQEGSRAYAGQASQVLRNLITEPGYESYRSRPDVTFLSMRLESLLVGNRR